MKLCDRCRVSGCCLNYLDIACKRARERECPDIVLTNAERISNLSQEGQIEFFDEVKQCLGCPPENKTECTRNCKKCWANYLAQSAEG